MKNAFKLRNQRWLYIENKYGINPGQWERYESMAEGTAHYVEHKIMSMAAMYEKNSLLKSDPHFKVFKKYHNENESVWCSRISAHTKKSYWYSLGFAYALVLDKLTPNWKTQPFDKKLFFDAYFKKLNLM